jgi:predicted amidophosphoribosyltransferase
MKYCKDCDKNYSDDKNFCLDCSKELTEIVGAKETKPIVHKMMGC